MTYSEKNELFHQLVAQTQEGIFERHESAGWRTWGWVKNKWARFSGSSAAATAGKVGVKLALLPLNGIPFVGAMISAAGSAAINVARRQWLLRIAQKGTEAERFHAMGELIPLKWGEAYVDAVRKVDDAARAMQNFPVQNCATYLEYLQRFYYWRYPMDRLWYYHMIMVEFLGQVDQKFQEADAAWKAMESDLKLNGPKIYDDWAWHRAHCNDECCTYPWDKLNISSPTLVETTADLGPMKLQPIKRTPPPLPPRPPRRP